MAVDAQIVLIEFRYVTWPDASMGCPQPDMVYIQIPMDGAMIRLQVDGKIYQYHTGTMTMKTEGLNERSPECFIEISKEDAEKYGLAAGAMATVASRRGDIKARVVISDKAVTGTAFLPFHFAEAAANKLTNAALDPVSGIPELKVCAVRLQKDA